MAALARGASIVESQGENVQVPKDRLFNQFCEETDLQKILNIFKDLCEEISLDPAQYEGFYREFKAAFSNWKTKELFKKFDERATQAPYCKQEACSGRKVLVVGAGPVGLRAAIEAALLGAQVDLVEKRTAFNRNNLLHLWPFLITDLKVLGAKKYYGHFCSSSIDHIAIKILQSILLRTCLILGVKVHIGTTFDKLVEPANKNSSWMVKTTPSSCPVSAYGFDIIIGADGKQNSLPGFPTKEFRGRLALAITVNFVNSNTEKEKVVHEISGVTSVYRQEFFKELISKHGIDLENIVYYRGDTHYFVMTAKKTSLIDRKVIKKDNSDPKELLAKGNIDRKALEQYARDATSYATEEQLKDLPFKKNHRGENDVALFDFTSLVKSEHAARIVERKGKKILLCLVGDSLLEPFWPTGTGCARGFLGAFDAAWMLKRFCAGDDPLEIIDEREAILYLLPQTDIEKLSKKFDKYSIDPKTRYLNLSEATLPDDVNHLFDTDDGDALQTSKNMRLSRSSFRAKHRTSVLSRAEEPGPTKSLQHRDNLPISELQASPSVKKFRQVSLYSPEQKKTNNQVSARSYSLTSASDDKQSSKKAGSQSTKSSNSKTGRSDKENDKLKDKSKKSQPKGEDNSTNESEKKKSSSKTKSSSKPAKSSIAKSGGAEPKRDDKKDKSKDAGPSRWSSFWSRIRGSRSNTPRGSTPESRRGRSKSHGTPVSLKEENLQGELRKKRSVSDYVKKYNDLDESAKNGQVAVESNAKTKKEKAKGKARAKPRDNSRGIKSAIKLEEIDSDQDDLHPPRRFCLCCCWK